jgi:hypothetical protein
VVGVVGEYGYVPVVRPTKFEMARAFNITIPDAGKNAPNPPYVGAVGGVVKLPLII